MPPAGAKLLGQWNAISDGKGVTVFESDDPVAMAKWIQDWSDTAAKLELCIAAQPAFNSWSLEPTEYLTHILGERAKRLNPIATMRRSGLRVAGGSDAPCTLPDPLAGVRAACLHPDTNERLTVGEALLLFTRDAAYLSFDERDRGTLQAGKRADYVILSENPLSLSPEELGRVKVETTGLAGTPYKPGQSLGSLLLRGLVCRSR